MDEAHRRYNERKKCCRGKLTCPVLRADKAIVRKPVAVRNDAIENVQHGNLPRLFRCRYGV
jgi:hypothetical protein